IAEDDERISARLGVLIRIKKSPQCGFHAEHIEVIRSRQKRVQLFGLSSACPVEAQREIRGRTHIGEDRIALAIVLEIRQGGGSQRGLSAGIERLGVMSEQLDQSGGLLHRQWMQEYGIDDGEDGGVSANTQAK